MNQIVYLWLSSQMQKSNFMPQFILDMKLQSWAKYYKQIHKIIAFSMEYFTAAFCNFLAQMSDFAFWVTGWTIALNSMYCTDFCC